jgi:magnesium chelatase family protein
MLAQLHSATITGIEAVPVTIEVSVTRGLGYQVTGLADDSIKESLSRIAIALQHIGFHMPRTKLLVHLAPANLRKSGSAFDLPIALGILLATGQIEDIGKLSRYLIAGKLSLDGKINPVQGALCLSELSAKGNFAGLLCATANAPHAALVKTANIYPVDHLRDVLQFIGSDSSIAKYKATPLRTTQDAPKSDFKNVVGQHRLKRAMEIAAAGGHHLLMRGFPGSGKTLCAKCLPDILPPMSEREMLETIRIQSLVNKHHLNQLITERPFCEIHPTISEAGLVGGSMYASPGQITAAHNGVLFMDEFSEYASAVLEALRQPLEERKITVARSKAVIEYPAAFMLVAAMNPCACGYHGHPTIKCRCSKRALWWHHRKISGPILDRFDLCVEAEVMEANEIFAPTGKGESSAIIQQRVIKARQRQQQRLQHHSSILCNAQLSHDLLKQYCVLDEYAKRFLQRQWNTQTLSMRALDKSLKVARTIADLAGTKTIELPHIAEALSFRFALPTVPAPSTPSNNKMSHPSIHSHAY